MTRLYWGAVFPSGMCTVCAFRLAQPIDAPVLLNMPRVFIYIALTAWALTAAGLVRDMARRRGRTARRGKETT